MGKKKEKDKKDKKSTSTSNRVWESVLGTALQRFLNSLADRSALDNNLMAWCLFLGWSVNVSCCFTCMA